MPSHLLPLPAPFPTPLPSQISKIVLCIIRHPGTNFEIEEMFFCASVYFLTFTVMSFFQSISKSLMYFSEKESELESRDKPTALLSGGVCEPCYDFYTFHLISVIDPPSVWGSESLKLAAVSSHLPAGTRSWVVGFPPCLDLRDSDCAPGSENGDPSPLVAAPIMS